MPNYRKRNNNANRNKNKNKNKVQSNTTTSSSSVKQEHSVVETFAVIEAGTEPNKPADISQNLCTTSAKSSVFEKNIVVVCVDRSSSPSSNEEIDENACSVDTDTNMCGSAGDTQTVQRQSNYSSTFNCSSSSSSSSKKSTEIERRHRSESSALDGDSTLGNSVITDTFVEVSSGKNIFKTGSANTKDATVPVAEKTATESTRIDDINFRENKSRFDDRRDVSKERSGSRESAMEVNENETQKVIVHSVHVKNNSTEQQVITQQTPPAYKTARVIVHQVSRDDPSSPSKVIVHQAEESRSTSHTAFKKEVDLSTKLSTKTAGSSTTPTLSFSNVQGQPSREFVHQIFSANDPFQHTSPANATVSPFSNVQGHPGRVIIQHVSKESDHVSQEKSSKVIVHQISKEGHEASTNVIVHPKEEPIRSSKGSVIVHQISKADKCGSSASPVIIRHNLPQKTENKVLIHQISSSNDANTKESSTLPLVMQGHDKFSSQHQSKANITQQPKKVIIIPIVQENSTQTSPLPSFNESSLHSNLLELIKDDQSQVNTSTNDREISRQTSSSPLSRSPAICFTNLSESLEEKGSLTSVPTDEVNITPLKEIVHPILQEGGTQTSPTDQSSSQIKRFASPERRERLEPLVIPSFPVTRHSKTIIRPIPHPELSQTAFSLSTKSLEEIDQSSGKIAHTILKDVASELRSSFFIKKSRSKVAQEPVVTSFPTSVKNQNSLRPGFFENKTHQIETNPVDAESKVIFHQISREKSKSPSPFNDHPSRSSGNTSESQKIETRTEASEKSISSSKVIVHQISRDEQSATSSTSNDKKEEYISNKAKTSQKVEVSSVPNPKTKPNEPLVIDHQISREEQNATPSTSSNKKQELFSINANTSQRVEVSSVPAPKTEPNEPHVIVHQISREKQNATPSTSNNIREEPISAKTKTTESLEDSTVPALKTDPDEPKVIVHQIFPSSSGSFPLPVTSSTESKKFQAGRPSIPPKPSSSFPISKDIIDHPVQYNSSSTVLEQKKINFKTLKEESKLRQSCATLTSPFSFPTPDDSQSKANRQVETKSNFPLSSEALNSHSSNSKPKEIRHQISMEKPKTTGFPTTSQISSKHQYSTSESKEIKHKVLKEEASSVCDPQQHAHHQQKSTISDSPESTFPLSKEKQNHPVQYNSSSHDRHSKSIDLQTLRDSSKLNQSTSQYNPSSSELKEVIHQVHQEGDTTNDHQAKDIPTDRQAYDQQTSQDESISSSEGSVLTAIQAESPRSISPPVVDDQEKNVSSEESQSSAPGQKEEAADKKKLSLVTDINQAVRSEKVIFHPIVRQIGIEKPLGYRVESPQPDSKPTIVKKSKSFDDDDVVIQEMSDASSTGDTDNPPLISEADSETDTLEAIDDYPETSTRSLLLSVQTLPPDHEDDNTSSPKSSQDYKHRRQQNRAALESHFLPQFLAPNFLDSIKEENSDLSDSERRSTCSDRTDRTDHSIPYGDLEDDVFLDPPKKVNAVFPKSNLDFSKKHKNVRSPKTSIIREEASPPSVVEAKIIDQGSVEESCSSWATDLTPLSEAAEVVYIDSASSSVSDLLELDYSQGQPEDPIDVRIQTPTIDLESVNDMFAACQQIESNDRVKTTTPSQTLPPVKEQENLSEQNLLPPHNNNDDRAHTSTATTTEERKILDEIISEKIETMSETIDTHANDHVVDVESSSSGRYENSNANNSNSCSSAINQVVTPSVVGLSKNMENIREIVSASGSGSGSIQKSELHKITDQTNDQEISTPNFMIGQPCSNHSFKCDTSSSPSSSTSSSSSSTNTTTTTTTTETKILTLHDLSQSLEDTKHLNPLVSFSSILDRQSSLDSHGSDQSHSTSQSQCTAINQGSLPNCDWNEFDTTTDTTYVSESDTAAGLASSENSSPFTIRSGNRSGDETESSPIRKLRSLCTEALASMPYGEEVLQELATVAQNIREMPYPLPDLPQIRDIQLSLGQQPEKSSVITLSQVPPRPGNISRKFNSPPPPPVPEPPTTYDSWLGVPTKSDPSVLVCLSPSQRNAVKNDSTADSLLDMHKKFVERRGYHEYTTKQVNAMNQANSQETQKLNKIDSPPPPPLPPRPSPIETSKSNGNTQAATHTNDDDQNNHRLLAIIRDTHESQQQRQLKSSMTSTSENISRKTENGTTNTNSGGGGHEKEFANSSSVSKQTQERLVSESNKSHSVHSEMQKNQTERTIKVDRESPVMGIHFPTSEYFDSIFDGKNKRFSNIETGSPTGFCSQILATQPKRYSNIETSSFESRKCVENGKVLYDVSDSKREKIREGDQPDSAAAFTSFPDLSKIKTIGLSSFPYVATPKSSDSRSQTAGDSENIMSAFKLNSQPTAPPVVVNRFESSPPAPPVPPLPQTEATLTADTTATTKTATTKSTTSTSESFINRNFNDEMREKTFDEFRQPAKEAAADTNQKHTTTSATATTKKSSEVAFQHEKLFKDFDELSNLLNNELESGKRRPPATLDGADIPSSVSDYHRVARESRIQSNDVSSTTHTETHRREQMKKLAEEIDRTTKQRREKRIPINVERKNSNPGPSSAPVLTQPRSFDIPVRVENGSGVQKPQRPSLQHHRSYEIPIRMESQSSGRQRTTSEHQSRHEIPIQAERPQKPERFRRAESMFNISDTTSSRHLGHDDWLKYVDDIGSSENVCKPFQREVEICFLGRRPNIRAPRMSASTNDLSSTHTFDTHGAYDVRRTTTTQTPRPQQPPRRSYLSSKSLIDTTPITPCVSSRRSPVPERRSSLPRELHDKQLKYITSKEQQLKYEFERLENERRQLIDEMNRTQLNQRISREAYRQRQLPPLTEDETFRQQMAEEWLDKVAEREERRLHKIIKISKINQETGSAPVAPPRRVSVDDIGDEFLRRVKERRSKLCMPSDSDWESGAESQPQPRTDGSRSETDDPPATVFEGQSAANINQLPKHLREFAKLSSQLQEEHREETTHNSSSSATKRSSMVTTVKTSNNTHHESQQTMQQDGRYPYKSNGYMSEPEPPNYDSDYSTVKYRTLERRRLQSTGTGTESRTSARTGNESQDETFYGTMPNPVKSGQGSYKVQPGRIENYITGHSSVSEKERKEQLDQQKLSPHYTEGNLSRALLKEQGYTSDSNLVFRKKDVPLLQSPLSPVEQKQVYKSVQAGGQPPLFGFRKPAPEKPKDDDEAPTPPLPPTKGVPLPLDLYGSNNLESPNRYFESDVNIHYKTPIRYEYKDPIPEEELAIRQAEQMQKLYQEERRRKYLQELQDMSSRRHTDNFTSSQKSPIPLNRYDDFHSDLAPKSPNSSNYPRTVARALYNFQGQTARELTFKKGDVIYIRRQIDKNWYEGEHNAMIGLLPSNYVELLTKDGIRQPPKKPSEGQARAKYNFQAQSGIELSLNKGEHVILTRRVDDNWFEGKIANRKGIFPVSYVEVLVDIGADDKAGRIPASQSIITQSSSSMRPSLDTLRTNINNEFNSLTSNGQQPPNGILRETRTLHKTEVLHVDTNTEPVAYRALYKYRPQNTDELELQEGDIVFVLEKCDDGWFVGTSQRSGCFGTFPGNYVERV